MLPEREITVILKKFGPRILQYLTEVGYFDQEGPYNPADLTQRRAMLKYLKASKAKNVEVWQVVERTLLPELEGTGQAFIEAYNLKPVINVSDIATEYFEKRGGQAIKKMTQTDQKKLINFIQANSMKNERVLARQMVLHEPNLSSIVDNSQSRARTIIRTERGRAIRGGSQSFAEGAGAKWKIWHTVGDSRVRKSHQALEGKKMLIGGEFPDKISKTTTIYSVFPSEKAINCRCWLEYGFTDDVVSGPAPSTTTLEALYA